MKWLMKLTASFLLVALLALGTLAAITNPNLTAGGINGLLTSVSANAQAATNEAASALIAQQVTGTQQTQPTQTTQQTQPGATTALDAATVVRQVGPAVVTVVNTQKAVTQGRRTVGGGIASGSGVIIDARGYIVTNNHVVVNQSSLQVIFSDGRTTAAQIVGTDAVSDLAVLKVSGTMPAVAAFGDSDALEPGQPVLAIGSPLGDYRNTVTEGVVSALHRSLDASSSVSLQNLVQTDAAINEGNSGGPLLDLNGRVIAINVAVVRSAGASGDTAEGLGFAIPSNTVREVANQLIASGSVSRPYIGITYELITPQMAAIQNLTRTSGILVGSVAPGSPADKAGIKPDSVITKFDGVQIGSGTSLADLLMKRKAGDSVKLSLVAPGSNSEQEVTIVLAVRPAS